MRRKWAGFLPRAVSARVQGVALLLRRPWYLRRRLDEIRLLRTSDLFDAVLYRSHYPDVARSGVDPLTHYVVLGALEGRQPGALFDARFYLGCNPDVARARLNPLVHYLRQGAAEGRSPNPLFDASFYLEKYPDVATSGLAPLDHFLTLGAREGRNPHPLFDTSFYLGRYPDVAVSGLNPLVHYLQYGAEDERNPHPLFDTSYYLRQYSDVAKSGLNPLVHYLQHGAKEGRNPHPLFDASYYLASRPNPGESNPLIDYVYHGADREADPSPLFDTAFYRETYGDAWASDRSPLEHYVCIGSQEGHSPHPLFDPTFYRAQYPDVARSGFDPLVHFVRYGAREGRDPNPMFDTSCYLERYPDVDAAGLNALDHYCRFGCREGRDTGPAFRTSLYLEENPLVRDSGVNALAHFLRSLPKDQDPRDTPFAFRSWLASYDSAGEAAAETMRSRVGRLNCHPSVSLIVAVREGVEWSALEATVESVGRQLYEAWELLVVLSPGVRSSVRDGLDRRSAEDRRIHVSNAPASEQWAMLQDGLVTATGDFVAFVGDDDLLDERALYLLAAELGDRPDAAVVYSDEDRIDDQGRRHHPHFKPDWNMDLFLGWNYLGRLVFLARQVVEKVGGIRGTFDPSHEYDLLLRVIDEAGDSRVRHLPWILCHRRAGGGPGAGAASAEEARSAVRALKAHLAGRGSAAVVEPLRERFQRVLYPLPEQLPLVSVIVTLGDRSGRLEWCLRTLLEKTDYPRLEILVDGNESGGPETSTNLRGLERPCRFLKYGGDVSGSAVRNLAVGQATGTIVVLLKGDMEALNPSWLTEMVRLSLRPDVGAVGAKIYNPDGTTRHAGMVAGPAGSAGPAFDGLSKGEEGYFARAVLTHEFSAVTGACLAMRRSVFDELGGFEQGAFPENFNDIDLCLRVRARGLKVLCCAQTELVDHESRPRGEIRHLDDPAASEFDRFRARWMHIIQDDPFYSPNLSLGARTFSLALPPRARRPLNHSEASPVARAASRLDPYATVDNWKRAAEVQDAPCLPAVARREWRPGLSTVILTLDRFELISPLLDQLAAARQRLAGRGLEVQIIVGDTGSTDERVLRKYEDLSGEIEVERNLLYHFSRCNNRLFHQKVAFDKTLFLNNDVVFADPTHSLMALARQIDEGPDVGIAGAVLTYPDGRVQHMGVDFHPAGPLRGLPFHPHHGGSPAVLEGLTEPRDCRAVTGACLVIRSRLFADLGGFDEGYRTEVQDVALCLAAWRQGYRCRLVPAGRIDHLENGTRPKGSEDWSDRQRMLRRWASFLEAGLC